MSRALRSEKGRFIPRRETIGLSIPWTITTKSPLSGFSLLTSTIARSPTALIILLARVLKAPHCLQAFTVTIVFLSLEAFVEEGVAVADFPLESAASFLEAGLAAAGAFFVLALVATAFLIADAILTTTVAFLGAAFLGAAFLTSAAGAAAALTEIRVDRRGAMINNRILRVVTVVWGFSIRLYVFCSTPEFDNRFDSAVFSTVLF